MLIGTLAREPVVLVDIGLGRAATCDASKVLAPFGKGGAGAGVPTTVRAWDEYSDRDRARRER